MGNFQFYVNKSGFYKIKFSHSGYDDVILDIDISSNVLHNLGQIFLHENHVVLHEIILDKNNKLVKFSENGGLLFQSKDLVVASSGSALDLLSNTPSVIVANENEISVLGKQPLILIDGRYSIFNNPDNIPAQYVQSIEVLPNPPGKFTTEGTGGIINIILKKNEVLGSGGIISGGLGYGAAPRGSFSFNYNQFKKNWDYGFNFNSHILSRTRNIDISRTNFNLTDLYQINTNQQLQVFEQNYSLGFYAKTNLNKRSNIVIQLLENFIQRDYNGNLTTQTQNNMLQKSTQNNRDINESQQDFGSELDINFTRSRSKFHFLKIDLNVTTNFNNGFGNYTYLPLNNAPIFTQKTTDLETFQRYFLQADFSIPIKNKILFETQYRGFFRISDFNFESRNIFQNNNLLNPLNSGDYTFTQSVHSIFAAIGNRHLINKTKFIYNLGLRYQFGEGIKYIENNLSSIGNGLRLFPYLNLNYNFSKKQSLSLIYTERNIFPPLDLINPFINITDTLNLTQGNFYIRPEFSSSLDLTYRLEKQFFSLNLSAFYRFTDNSLFNSISIDSLGNSLREIHNFDYSLAYGFDANINIKPVKEWNLNLSFSIFNQYINGLPAQNILPIESFNWYGKLLNSLVLNKYHSLQCIYNHTAPQLTTQGKTIQINYIDLGWQYKFKNEKAALSVLISDIFNTQNFGYQINNAQFYFNRLGKIDTRAIFITFTYSFKQKVNDKKIKNDFNTEF